MILRWFVLAALIAFVAIMVKGQMDFNRLMASANKGSI